MTNIGNSKFVVGIDIGSEDSGYAFASRDNAMHDPPRLSTNIWMGSKLLSLKCPTVILLDIHEEMIAFGYEAEDRFCELMEDGEHHDYYYFRHFRDDIHQVFLF